MIYLIGTTVNGPVKIGMSRDPLSRLATLQTASAEKLRVLALGEGVAEPCSGNAYFASDKTSERMLHLLFAGVRKEGEWFDVNAYEVMHISGRGDFAFAEYTFSLVEWDFEYLGWKSLLAYRRFVRKHGAELDAKYEGIEASNRAAWAAGEAK